MVSNGRPSDLIHDWNLLKAPPKPGRAIELDDETLRDGLQCPSATDPELDAKIDLIRRMSALGITTADVGLPGAGTRARTHIETLVKTIRDEKLPIEANVACRTVLTDIQPAA